MGIVYWEHAVYSTALNIVIKSEYIACYIGGPPTSCADSQGIILITLAN